MGVLIYTRLCCDTQGCYAGPEADWEQTPVREQRKMAQSEGWVRVNGKDYCPKHAPRHKAGIKE